jgi:subtilase family serine protease
MQKPVVLHFFDLKRNFLLFPGFSPKKGSKNTTMRMLRTFPLSLVACAMLISLALLGTSVSHGQSLASAARVPVARITDHIDEGNLVTLKGNTHPFANAQNDRGRVSPSLPMTDLILVLSRSPERQAAFDAYVSSEYDPASPNFHHWLQPAEVGTNFGPSPADLATVTSWLTTHGFSVDEVTKDNLSIRFSGNARQVEGSFHTEMHNLDVKGVQHIGNMSDPQIPAALAPVVVGVKALHNFFPRPLHRMGSRVQLNSAEGKWQRVASTTSAGSTQAKATSLLAARPEFGIRVPASGANGTTAYLVEDVSPADFGTIYNIQPLWKSGIDGTGQTIAVAGTSDVDLTYDIPTFRSFFGLPAYTTANQPQIIHPNPKLPGGDDPGICTSTSPTAICGIGDLIENSLDVEWTGAIAPNAQIVLVNGVPQSPSDDNLYDAESYIVNNLTARIMNVSYGQCELYNGTSGNVEYYNLWQQAAAEGIAVFVASGDSGSASCDQGGDSQYGTPYPAEYGLSVSGLASTPFNTAVGGTDLNWCSPAAAANGTATTAGCTAPPYWNTSSTANRNSAIDYVPEVPWNNTCANPLALGFLQGWATALTQKKYSGVVSPTDPETACNFINQWWSIIYYATGGLSGGVDLSVLVDTVGGSGGASGCVVSDGNNVSSCLSSTTSTGAANGSIPLVNDGWPKPSWQTGVPGIPTDGVRDLPDVSFFASNGTLSSSAYLICVHEDTIDSSCDYSTSAEPFAQEVGGTSVASPAMAAIMALINQKAGAAQGNPNAELYALAAKQTYSSCSAETAKVGDGCYFNDIDAGKNPTPYTNAMPCDDGVHSSGLSPNCTVVDAVDKGIAGGSIGILSGYSAGTGYDLATGLGSLNVANVVNAWPATVIGSATSTVAITAPSTLNSTNTLAISGTVTGVFATNGVTVPPTGTVTLTATSTGLTTFTVTVPLLNIGTFTETVPANTLSAGIYSLVATYNGDMVYAAHSSSPTTVAVTTPILLIPTVTVTATPSAVNSNSATPVSVAVTVSGSGAIPTSTVTLTSGSYSSGAQTLAAGTTSASYTFSIPVAKLISGSNTITVVYSGDSIYKSVTSTTATVAVTESTVTLNATTPAAVAPGASATSTITATAVGGYSGTVTFTCLQTSTTATGGDGTTCSGGGGSTGAAVSPGTNGSVTFTVGTTAAVARLEQPKLGNGWEGAGGGAVLALLMLFGIPARRRSWRAMLGIFVVMMALGTLSGCNSGASSSGGGGGGASDPGTAAGTYTFTVTATGSPSVPAPAPTITFTVTVN